MMQRFSRPTALLVAMGCFSMPLAVALEATVDISHTAEYTTNTARTEDDEIGEWINRPAIEIGLRRDTSDLELGAEYRFERRIFQEDVFSDSNAVIGRGALVWHALPERLEFLVRNTRTESTERSRDPLTEANRQTVATTEVGPTLKFRPRANDELQFQYLYVDVNADETRTDSERRNAAVRYIMGLSSVRQLTFAANHSKVDFDSSIAPDLEISSGSITLDQTGSKLDTTLTGGYSETKRELGRDTVRGPLFELGASWRVTSITEVGILAGYQITDRSNDLIRGLAEVGGTVAVDTDLNEVFAESRAAITISHPFGNNQLSLALRAAREDYEDVLRDNELTSIGLTFARDLSSLTRLRASFDVTRRKYTDEGFEQDEYRGALQLEHRVSPKLAVSVGARYDEWDADTAGRSYSEWIGDVSLRYALVNRR